MKDVITHSGLGNQKDGEREFGYQPQKGVTFVVVNGLDWYIREMERGIGMEDSRRNHLRQIQAAIDCEELDYYEPLSETEFTNKMVDWSRMNHEPVPKKAKRKNTDVSETVLGELKNLFDGYPSPETFIYKEPKIGRNEQCPCGSGKKFKKCCGR